MITAHKLLGEIVRSLRTVIGPAIPDPYPKAQAFMAAVVLEFIARQVEERQDIPLEKEHILNSLFSDLPSLLAGKEFPDTHNTDKEERLCRLIEWLYTEKDRLGPEVFNSTNQQIRTALRQLLNQELKVAGTKE